MRGWLLDTNIVAEMLLARPEPRVRAWINAQPSHRVTISILTLAEMEHGLEALPPPHPRRREIAQSLSAVETLFVGRIRSIDDSIVRRWARLRGQARRHFKKSPPPIDALLAATAIEHDLYLATRNTRDMQLTGARLFDPWRDDPALFPLK
jgi:predicted nucleic acid-binding protein